MPGEKMILSHEPEPGYRTVFYVSVGISFLYLVVLLLIYI